MAVELQEEPFGFFDKEKHPRGAGGRFRTGGLGSLIKGAHQGGEFIPTYSGKPLVFGKHAGGSNGARWAFHQGTGQRWLVKHYRGDQDRVATELLSNAIYREMGARVPRAGKLRLDDGRTALTYPTLPGSPSPFVFHRFGGSRALGRHFMTDALLANWDVAGLEDDNVLWDEEGRPARVDQGGTLEMRAMGGPKPFGPVPVEVRTMMDPDGQARRSMVVDDAGMRRQAAEIAERLPPERIDRMVAEAPFRDRAMAARVAGNLKARVAWMGRFATGHEPYPSLQEDGWERDDLAEALLPHWDFHWDEAQHPRDEHGRFRQSLIERLHKYEKIRLGKVSVYRDKKTGLTAVSRSGKISKFKVRGTAVRAALDASARGTEPDSVGGTTKFKDYNDYLAKAHGVNPLDPGFMNGRGEIKPSGLQNLLTQEQGALHAAEASELQGERNGIPTLRSRIAELQAKIKAAGGSPSASPGPGDGSTPTGAAALEKLKAMGYGPGAEFLDQNGQKIAIQQQTDGTLGMKSAEDGLMSVVTPEAFLGQAQGANGWELLTPGHDFLAANAGETAQPGEPPDEVSLGMKLAALPKGEYHALGDDLTIKKQDNGSLTVLSDKDGVLGVHGSALDAAHQALTHQASSGGPHELDDFLPADLEALDAAKAKGLGIGDTFTLAGTKSTLIHHSPGKVAIESLEPYGTVPSGDVGTPLTPTDYLKNVVDKLEPGGMIGPAVKGPVTWDKAKDETPPRGALFHLAHTGLTFRSNGMVTISGKQRFQATVVNSGKSTTTHPPGKQFDWQPESAKSFSKVGWDPGAPEGAEIHDLTPAQKMVLDAFPIGSVVKMPSGVTAQITGVGQADGIMIKQVDGKEAGHEYENLSMPTHVSNGTLSLVSPPGVTPAASDPFANPSVSQLEGDLVGLLPGEAQVLKNGTTIKRHETALTWQVQGPGADDDWKTYGDAGYAADYALNLDEAIGKVEVAHPTSPSEILVEQIKKIPDGGSYTLPGGTTVHNSDGMYTLETADGDILQSYVSPDSAAAAAVNTDSAMLGAGQQGPRPDAPPPPMADDKIADVIGMGWNGKDPLYVSYADGTTAVLLYDSLADLATYKLQYPGQTISAMSAGEMAPKISALGAVTSITKTPPTPSATPAAPEPLKVQAKISGKDAIAALPIGTKVKILKTGTDNSYHPMVWEKTADGWKDKLGGGSTFEHVTGVKVEKLPKPIKGLQANAGKHKLKDLDVAVGDVVQLKKGGWKYTVTSVQSYGGVKAKAANGTLKAFGPQALPGFIQKADGSHLAPKPVPTVTGPKIGDQLLDSAGMPFTVDSIVSGKIHATFDTGYTTTFDVEDAQKFLAKGIWKANPSPVKPPTVSELKAKLKEPTGSTPVMKNLPDGAVIATPTGQVGILKPGEDAYTGYVAAYDVTTGQKFEPPASKHPALYSDDPEVMAAAAARLKLAQTAKPGSVTVAGSGSGGSATQGGPPPEFNGALTDHEAASKLKKWQDEADLTHPQESSVGTYVGSSKDINEKLRDSKGIIDENLAKVALNMAKAATAVIQERTIIVRKTNLPEWQNATAGKIIRDNGFFSASWSPGAISTGGVYGGSDAPIELHVMLKPGDHFIFPEAFGHGMLSEKEVILPPGKMFKVLKTEKKGGVTKLYVETFN